MILDSRERKYTTYPVRTFVPHQLTEDPTHIAFRLVGHAVMYIPHAIQLKVYDPITFGFIDRKGVFGIR